MVDFHSLKINKVFEILKTSKKGLSQKEAQRRFEKNGSNEIPKEKPLSRLNIFFSPAGANSSLPVAIYLLPTARQSDILHRPPIV